MATKNALPVDLLQPVLTLADGCLDEIPDWTASTPTAGVVFDMKKIVAIAREIAVARQKTTLGFCIIIALLALSCSTVDLQERQQSGLSDSINDKIDHCIFIYENGKLLFIEKYDSTNKMIWNYSIQSKVYKTKYRYVGDTVWGYHILIGDTSEIDTTINLKNANTRSEYKIYNGFYNKKVYDKENNFIMNIGYKRDSNGVVIDSIIGSKNEYIRNKKGKIIKEKQYFAGELSSVLIYEYDDRENLTLKKLAFIKHDRISLSMFIPDYVRYIYSEDDRLIAEQHVGKNKIMYRKYVFNKDKKEIFDYEKSPGSSDSVLVWNRVEITKYECDTLENR